MSRHLWTVVAGISAVALLAACGSTGSNSPATRSVADSAPTMSSSPTDELTSASAPSLFSGTGPAGESAARTVDAQSAITVSIGATSFSATLADTATAQAFADRLPLTLDMRDVNNNEKAFELEEALPGVAANPGSITNGDLLLYGSSTIVLFYESFDTPYSYSRIGALDDPDGLAEVLGAGDVTVTFAGP